ASANVFYRCFDGLKGSVDTQIRCLAPEVHKLLVWSIHSRCEIRSHLRGRRYEIVNQRTEKIKNNGLDCHCWCSRGVPYPKQRRAEVAQTVVPEVGSLLLLVSVCLGLVRRA